MCAHNRYQQFPGLHDGATETICLHTTIWSAWPIAMHLMCRDCTRCISKRILCVMVPFGKGSPVAVVGVVSFREEANLKAVEEEMLKVLAVVNRWARNIRSRSFFTVRFGGQTLFLNRFQLWGMDPHAVGGRPDVQRRILFGVNAKLWLISHWCPPQSSFWRHLGLKVLTIVELFFENWKFDACLFIVFNFWFVLISYFLSNAYWRWPSYNKNCRHKHVGRLRFTKVYH